MDKGACSRAWLHEFEPQAPHDRRESTPAVASWLSGTLQASGPARKRSTQGEEWTRVSTTVCACTRAYACTHVCACVRERENAHTTVLVWEDTFGSQFSPSTCIWALGIELSLSGLYSKLFWPTESSPKPWAKDSHKYFKICLILSKRGLTV